MLRVGLLFSLLLGACSAGGPGNERRGDHSGGAGSGGGTGSETSTRGAGPTGSDAGDSLTGDLPDGGNPAPEGCGDAELAEDEVCDDGNLQSGDGCAANCLALEPGFSCAVPGRACIVIARCGDGVVAPSEQCDDGNTVAGDGCSERCRVELGSKCSDAPSVCTATTCGDGVQEGAEACDDGNGLPFDGCSALCLREPSCEGLSCTSDCGDGLLINEDCDDGNAIDGDGCSSTCTVENGFTCTRESSCERIDGACILRVPVIFRDFSDAHADFGNHGCNALVLGALSPELGADGRPLLSGTEAAQQACIGSDSSFADWYTDTDQSAALVDELVLFDNGAGGFVNRFGAEGEQFVAVDPQSEKTGGASQAECEQTCVQHAQNGEQPMFDAPLRCEDVCRPVEQERSDLVSGELSRLEGDLNRASDAVPRDEALIAEIEADIAAVEAQIAELEAAVAVCQEDCEAELAERVSLCAATCKTCSSDPERWCIGGEAVSFDGNPLFFPVDSITGDTANSERAQIPQQYGYSNWPWEDQVFPGASNHNFYFTSEVQYWFRYDTETSATLEFLGDDDVWVFLNGRLAVDLGGIHAPATGSVTIDAASSAVSSTASDGEQGGVSATTTASAAEFGLAEGNVYTISIFHAERQLSGSSFKLTLSGFEATPSDCSAVCGDGILSFGEECDDGTNDGGYGECAADCKLGPFCGDGIVQEGEDCDDGPGGGAGCPNCRIVTVK